MANLVNNLCENQQQTNTLKPHLTPVQGGAHLKSMNVLSGAIHQADARIKVKFTCQDDVMNLHCQSPRAIKIYKAEYSRRQNSICNRGKRAQYCDPVDKMSLVRKFCEGQMKCNVSVDKNTMGDECPTVFKYLNVLYECSKYHYLYYFYDEFVARFIFARSSNESIAHGHKNISNNNNKFVCVRHFVHY